MIKLLVLSSLVALAYSQSGPGVPDRRCPPGTTNPPLHLNDPTNCSRFFVCANGLAVPFDCPPGQHWSVRDNWCDWPDRARCEPGRDTRCPPGNTTPPAHLPHERDCRKFYKCSWGVPIEMECPHGQHWSVSHGWCDWPDRANCKLGGSSRENSRESNSRERNSRERNSRERR